MRRRFMVGSGAKNPVPSNQIWYTTYTGLVDVPFNDNFGASLISNVYENGTGIMTFDGDIDTIPSHAFMDNELNSRFASLMFPDTITNVETYAFVDNQYIDYINLGNGVTIIEQEAFIIAKLPKLFWAINYKQLAMEHSLDVHPSPQSLSPIV